MGAFLDQSVNDGSYGALTAKKSLRRKDVPKAQDCGAATNPVGNF